MIMPDDCQFQCAHYCSFPDISHKMECAPWLCIYDSGCNLNFVVNELFFFRVRHLKMREKRINPLFAQTFVDILHAFGWLFEVTL